MIFGLQLELNLNANQKSCFGKRIEWNGNIDMYKGTSGKCSPKKPKQLRKSNSNSAPQLPKN